MVEKIEANPTVHASAEGWPKRACILKQMECHELKPNESERDLILKPRLLRVWRVCLEELIIFQVKGLTQESLGTGPEKGKASAQVDRS